MEPNSYSIHLFVKDQDNKEIEINIKDSVPKTKGFPEVLKLMVDYLIARSNEGKPVSIEEAKKIFRIDEDIKIRIIGGMELE